MLEAKILAETPRVGRVGRFGLAGAREAGYRPGRLRSPVDTGRAAVSAAQPTGAVQVFLKSGRALRSFVGVMSGRYEFRSSARLPPYVNALSLVPETRRDPATSAALAAVEARSGCTGHQMTRNPSPFSYSPTRADPVHVAHDGAAELSFGMMPAMHPRMGDDQVLSVPGIFGREYSPMMPAGVVMLHLIFGLIVGVLY